MRYTQRTCTVPRLQSQQWRIDNESWSSREKLLGPRRQNRGSSCLHQETDGCPRLTLTSELRLLLDSQDVMLMRSLPKDREEMEQKVRKWIFGDKSPSSSSAGSAPPVSSRNAASTSQPVPVPSSASTVDSSMSNLSIASPRE